MNGLSRCRGDRAPRARLYRNACSVDGGVGWHVRWRIAARRISDATVAARKIAHLRLPVGVVGRELVQEDDRRSAPRLFVVQANVILGDGMGISDSFDFLFSRNILARLALKIAVNSRGCNNAILLHSRHLKLVELPWNRLPRRHMKSCSGHIRTQKRRPRSYGGRARGGSWVRGCSRGSSMLQSFAFRRSLRFVVALALCIGVRRRVCLSGFGKASSWCRAARARRPSRQASSRLPPPSPRSADVAP